MRSFRTIVRAVRPLAKAAIAFFLLLVLAFIVLQTPLGQGRMAYLLAILLERISGFEVRISGLSGSLPLEVRLDELELMDGDGVWLSARHVILRWSPRELLCGLLRVEQLEAVQIDFMRPPGLADSDGGRPPSFGGLFSAFRRLTVDDWRVDRLSLGEGVLGQEAVLHVSGRVAAREGAGALRTQVRVRSWAQPLTKASLDLRSRLDEGEGPSLNLSVDLMEERGGVISGLLGMSSAGPFHLSLVGAGPLRAWEGRLLADAAGLGSATASVWFRDQGGLLFSAEGVVHPGPEAGRPLAADTFRFACRMRFPDGPSLLLEELYVNSSSGEALTARGLVDLSSTEFWTALEMRAVDLEAHGLVASLVGLKAKGRMELRGQLLGTYRSFRAGAALSLRDFATESTGVSILGASLSVQTGAKRGLSLRGEGWILKATYGGRLLPVSGRIGWAFEALWPHDGGIIIERLDLRGGRARAHIFARRDPADDAWQAQVSAMLTDLTSLGQYLGAPLHGSTELKAALTWDIRDGLLSAAVKGRWSEVGFPEELTAVLGDEVGYEANLVIRSEGPISLEDVTLRAKGASVTGGARISPSTGHVDARWTLKIPTLDDLWGPLGIPVTGSAEIGGTLMGSLPSLGVEAQGSLRGLRIWRKEIPEAFLALTIPDIWGGPRGRADLTMKAKGASPLRIRSDLALEGRMLMLSALRAETPGAKAEGSLFFHLDRGLLEGNLAGGSEDLSKIGAWIGVPLGGKGKGRIHLEVSQEAQMAEAELSASNLKTFGGEVKQMLFKARVREPFGNPQGDLELQGRDLERGTISLRDFSVSTTGSLQALTVRARAKGDQPGSFEVALEGRVEDLPSFSSASLTLLQGKWASQRVGLIGQAILRRQAREFVLEKTQLEVGPALLVASGSFASGNIDAEASFEGTVPEELWAQAGVHGLGGRISGNLRTEGTMEDPLIHLYVDGQGFFEKGSGTRRAKRVAFSASAEVNGGRFQGSFVMRGADKEEIRAEVSLPFRVSLYPFHVTQGPSGPLKASVAGEADLSLFELFVLPEDHLFGGRARADLSARGTLRDPILRGTVRISKGRYEHPGSGTILKGAEVSLVGDGRRLLIQEATAEDGDKGVVEASGWISLEPCEGFPLSLDLRLEDISMFRHDFGTARAKGSLNITGSLANPTLGGALYLAQGELSIPDSLDREIPLLEVTEINLPERTATPRKEPLLAPPSRIGLNLSMELPGRLWLRGRGLESEWSGFLKFDGDSLDPIVNGRLSVQRGHFQFFGKRFVLKEGFIHFDGKVPPDPYVQMEAEASAGGITANLRLSGPSSALSVTLSSTPPLPVDEILSRVLFGRTKAQITPIQAATLAHSLMALSGKASDLGIMDRLRTTFGLDVMEVKESSRSGPEGISSGLSGFRDTVIGIGKYLTDDVFLKVERGIAPGTGRVSVEVEMTPQISLETELGEDASAGIGLKYRLDY